MFSRKDAKAQKAALRFDGRCGRDWEATVQFCYLKTISLKVYPMAKLSIAEGDIIALQTEDASQSEEQIFIPP